MNEYGIVFLLFAAVGLVLVLGGLWGDSLERRDARRRNRR